MTALKLSVDDPEFVDKIIFEVKSQGHFDLFRKECLADVDTQPAYQNLHSRVEDSVQKFLNRQVWTPETNKNRLREEMRHNIIRAGYLEGGVTRIVDQIVEQKMDYIQSKVEEILYQYVGIEKQQNVKKENGALEIDTDLLPTDLELEQVSPDSDKKSNQGNEEIEEEVVDDFESPAFEPIGIDSVAAAPEEKLVNEENQNSNLSEISGLTSQDSPTEKVQSEKEDETMLSQISSNEKSSTFVNPDNEMTGEEAQMPPENNDESTTIKEPEPMVVESPKFDLHKDSIEFTGTERKNILSDESTSTTSSNDDKVSAPPPVPSTHLIEPKSEQMEVDNIEDNDTTDSSEVRMEIDLKDESTQESSSKVEDNSQDSSQKIREKEKDSHSHHKHHRSDRSKDRYKSSSSHKSGGSSSHRHHLKSSSSRHESSTDKHKSRSGKSSSSASSHKKSSANTSDKEKDKDKEKDRTSSSSSSHKKSKYRDEHHSSSSSKSRRKSTEHEPVTDEKAKTDNEKIEDKTTTMTVEQSEKSESSAAELKKKSSILMKYDYLKAESTNEKQRNDDQNDDEDCSDFLGFEHEQSEPVDNPWIQLLQNESERNRKKNSDQKIISIDGSTATHTSAKTKVTRKSKSPDMTLNTREESTPETKTQQQRYETQDLYKPRFDFSYRQRSNRRGQNFEESTTTSSSVSSETIDSSVNKILK